MSLPSPPSTIDRTTPYSAKYGFITLRMLASRINYYNETKEYAHSRTWTEEKRLAFIDSLLRETKVTPIVLWEVPKSTLSSQTVPAGLPIYDVLDGYQRIYTIFLFICEYLHVPTSLNNLPEYVCLFENEIEEHTVLLEELSDELKSRIREIKHPVITISPRLDLDEAQYKQARCDCIARLEEIITSVMNNCRTEHEVDPASSALVTWH